MTEDEQTAIVLAILVQIESTRSSILTTARTTIEGLIDPEIMDDFIQRMDELIRTRDVILVNYFTKVSVDAEITIDVSKIGDGDESVS